MFEPAERLKNVKVSASAAMTRKVRELRAQGVKIVGLSSGEPDFMSPRHAIEADDKCRFVAAVSFDFETHTIATLGQIAGGTDQPLSDSHCASSATVSIIARGFRVRSCSRGCAP